MTKTTQAQAMMNDATLRDIAQETFILSARYDWTYQWTWLGLPIIQSPIDIVAAQEVVWRTRPDLVIECGVARGGSLILWASLLDLLGIADGQVVGIDVDIRPHNRVAIDEHRLSSRIHLIDGSSTDPDVIKQVEHISIQHNAVMAVLDSNHTHQHVLEELRAYAPMVTIGQYILVSDTLIEKMPLQTARPRAWGPGNNPATAVAAFLAETSEFEVDSSIDEKLLLSSSLGGYLRRRS